MVIKHQHLDLRIQPTLFERTDPIRLMSIDQNQLRYLRNIEIFKLGEIQVMRQKKGMHGFLRPAGQHQPYIRIQFPHSDHRSQAVEAALADKVHRLARTRLARESAKLNPKEEKRLADEGLIDTLDAWPEY